MADRGVWQMGVLGDRVCGRQGGVLGAAVMCAYQWCATVPWFGEMYCYSSVPSPSLSMLFLCVCLCVCVCVCACACACV